MDFVIKSGDSLPAISTTLARSDGTTADLTQATVHFVMRAAGATDPKVNSVATIVGDPTLGRVVYFWSPSDTNTPGIYDGSWVVTFASVGTPRQTFPTNDYLEISIEADLSKTGGLLVNARPTDGIRPPVSAVGALLAQRGKNRVGVQFGPNSTPTYAQVQSIIDSVAGDIDGELDGVDVTGALASMARLCITYGAAATVELTFFPEQANSGGDTSGVWWTRYQMTLTRFRTLLESSGGGVPQMGSSGATSWTRQAARDYAADLALIGVPDIWNDPYAWPY